MASNLLDKDVVPHQNPTGTSPTKIWDWNLQKEIGVKIMIRRKEWWEIDIGFTIGWNMTWDIQLSEKMVKDDVRIANRWKTDEKWAKMPKLRFLPSAMRV